MDNGLVVAVCHTTGGYGALIYKVPLDDRPDEWQVFEPLDQMYCGPSILRLRVLLDRMGLKRMSPQMVGGTLPEHVIEMWVGLMNEENSRNGTGSLSLG